MSKTKNVVIDDQNKKQETIKYLTDLMATIQMAHFKGRLPETIQVNETGEAGISIDLYNFDGDGKPVCEGLTFQREYHKGLQQAFCIVYNPDWEDEQLLVKIDPIDEGDYYDLLPEDLPDGVLTAITQWMEKAMVPEQKPDTAPNAKDIIALWSDWCMDYADENLWLDYMVKHPKGHCNRQHLQEKWDYCYEKYGSKAAMTMFWRELDNDNRTILTEYITTQWHKN